MAPRLVANDPESIHEKGTGVRLPPILARLRLGQREHPTTITISNGYQDGRTTPIVIIPCIYDHRRKGLVDRHCGWRRRRVRVRVPRRLER